MISDQCLAFYSIDTIDFVCTDSYCDRVPVQSSDEEEEVIDENGEIVKRKKKKGLKEKIKEKLPGGHKDSNQQDTATGATGTGAHGTEGTGEKKGLMDKIKEKLPGQH